MGKVLILWKDLLNVIKGQLPLQTGSGRFYRQIANKKSSDLWLVETAQFLLTPSNL